MASSKVFSSLVLMAAFTAVSLGAIGLTFINDTGCDCKVATVRMCGINGMMLDVANKEWAFGENVCGFLRCERPSVCISAFVRPCDTEKTDCITFELDKFVFNEGNYYKIYLTKIDGAYNLTVVSLEHSGEDIVWDGPSTTTKVMLLPRELSQEQEQKND